MTNDIREKAEDMIKLLELFDSHKPNKRPLTECAEDIAKAALNTVGKVEE